MMTASFSSDGQLSNDDRRQSISVLVRLADPLLIALSEHQLKNRLPVFAPRVQRFAPLEALGRLMAGISPWLELGTDSSCEGIQRARFICLAVQALRSAVDPDSPDFMEFGYLDGGMQPLVDAAFLAHGLLRAPTQLWGNLDETARLHLIAALRRTREIQPWWENNWLLFSAMVETALWRFTGDFEPAPIERAISKHMEWYHGDGIYGDGPMFHWDYYNSYVIQPMLLDIVGTCHAKEHPLGRHLPTVLKRAQRYGEILFRLISPEGTFPVLGRSSTYRFGALHILAQLALGQQLPSGVESGAVRSALTAVIRRMIEAPNTFDESGWLRPGVVGSQPSIAEDYISCGSSYLCATGLLHLGLSPEDPFWGSAPAMWPQQRIWSGHDVAADHALD